MLGIRIPHPKCASPLCSSIAKRVNFMRRIIGSTRLLSTRLPHFLLASHNGAFQRQQFRVPSYLNGMAKRGISSVSKASGGAAVGRSMPASGTPSPLTDNTPPGTNGGVSLSRQTIRRSAHVATTQSNGLGEESISESSLSEAVSTPGVPDSFGSSPRRPSKTKSPELLDPEADIDVSPDEEEVKEALSRPPAVNSSYLPLPWKGRLGYACLCTYLRTSNPPVFSSRTCRISSILENRHPLKDPSQAPHPTKNRPDRDQPADIALGHAFVQSLGLANARDVVKMLRWNDRFGIKFMRLSSEMFPFASHAEYGYKLAPFASEVLAEAGQTAADLGHRLTVHPGQFTQLGSPRSAVIESSVRDLEYHAEMLSLLKLPLQQDRDAVMILHMGGVYGDKAATLDRFRENYAKLSANIKNRLVLENDDVSWTVHDLLPICEELNIPLVLDYHHHNIHFDADKIREGTLDIIELYDRIKATWTRKGITQKMHYSEPTPQALTKTQRRKHNPRVQMLPPCDPTMDLMIEAKDKEQAVFDLMRTYKLPGFEKLNYIVPHSRNDENKPIKRISAKKNNKDPPPPRDFVPDEKVGMGGPEGRVYWPLGMEHWLRPQKRVTAKREASEKTPERKKRARSTKTAIEKTELIVAESKTKSSKKATGPSKPAARRRGRAGSTSSSEPMDMHDEEASTPNQAVRASRRTKGKKIDYAEE